MTKANANKILKRLKEQEKEEGSLPLLLEFYKKLLQIQSRVQKRIGTAKVNPGSTALQKRQMQGLPMIDFNEIDLDWTLLREVFVDIIAAFAEYPQLFGEIPDKLKEKEAGRLLTKKAIKAWFTGNELPAALREGVSDTLIETVLQATLQPFLKSYAEAMTKSVKQEQWRQPYCPICGGSPDLAYLEKEVGARWLLCSRCNTEWLFQRLECPYCGTKDQSALSFFSDEEGLYRLYVCEQCKCYLKAIDLRKTESEVLLPLERLYTMDLDSQARERGYHFCQKPMAKNN